MIRDEGRESMPLEMLSHGRVQATFYNESKAHTGCNFPQLLCERGTTDGPRLVMLDISAGVLGCCDIGESVVL